MTERDWYVAVDGEVLGPVPASELAAIIATRPSSVRVWADGLAGWTDPSEVGSLGDMVSFSSPSKPAVAGDLAGGPEHAKPSLAQRARRELIEYAVIACYLYVCFGTLILYKASILRGEGISFAPFGFAVAKALVLGKFLLLLKAAKIGDRRTGGGRMILDIGRNALLFAALLIMLSIVEEIVVGLLEHKSAAALMAELTGHTGLQALATSLIMVLVLVPYFAFHEITERLGEGTLKRMLLERYQREARR